MAMTGIIATCIMKYLIPIVNMLYYIIGEEVLFEMMDGIAAWHENWDNQADEETNAEILKAIEKFAE
jgi:hypothetical protein